MPSNTPRPNPADTPAGAAPNAPAYQPGHTAITRADPTASDWPVITRAHMADWTGHWLTEEQTARFTEQIGRSSLPAAFSAMIASLGIGDDLVTAQIDDQALVVDLVARYRAVAAQEFQLYHSYPGTRDQIDAAVLPYQKTRDRIRDLLAARDHAELATALLRERDTLGVIHDCIAHGYAGDVPALYQARHVAATRAVDRLTAASDRVNRQHTLGRLVVVVDDQLVAWPVGEDVNTAPLTAAGRIDWNRTTPAPSGSRAARLTARTLNSAGRLAELRPHGDQVRFLPPDDPAGCPDVVIRPEQGAMFWLIEDTLFTAHLEPDGLIGWKDLAEVEWSTLDEADRVALREIARSIATGRGLD